MTKESKQTTSRSPSPNLLIIGVPLIIAAVFSFSFISMYPNEASAPLSKAKSKPVSENKETSLPPITITAAKLQTLTPLEESIPTESQPTSPSGGGGVAATSQSPQDANDDKLAATTDEVQSAAQPKNLYNIKIKVPKTPAVKSPTTSTSQQRD